MAEIKRSANPSTTPRRRRAATAKSQVAGQDPSALAPTDQAPTVQTLADASVAAPDAGVAPVLVDDAASCPNPAAAAEIEAISHDPVAMAVAHAPHGSSEDSDYAALPASYP